MKTGLVVTALSLSLLGGCALPAANSNQLVQALTKLANTATGDLNSAVAVADAATPVDADGATCAEGGLTVVSAMQKELMALPAGATVGLFTTAEVASLYAPGSAQTNFIVKTIETACIAKLHDVNQAGASLVGVFATLGGVVAAAGG